MTTKNKINLSDVMVGNSMSLRKLVGSEIVDVTGYVSGEFPDPVFKVSTIVFANGTHVWVEGEHDIAYLAGSLSGTPALNVPNLDYGTIRDLYRQQQIEDGEEVAIDEDDE
jgi:hypothetical protein